MTSTRPFQVGDRVRIVGWDTYGPHEGTITEILPARVRPDGFLAGVPRSALIVTDCAFTLDSGTPALACAALSEDLTGAGWYGGQIELIDAADDDGRVHDVAEAERQAYVVEAEWAPVVPDPHAVDYARALIEGEPADIGEDAWTRYESIRDDIALQNRERLASGPSIIRRVLDRIDETELHEALQPRCEATTHVSDGYDGGELGPCDAPATGTALGQHGQWFPVCDDHAEPQGEPADIGEDDGVPVERPVWDDERHIWVDEHTPELPDDGRIER